MRARLRPAATRAIFAGLSGTLVGIGLARFAYSPLIPAVIAAGWFGPSQAVYLGAANLLGYLAGALGARPLARRLPLRRLLRGAMLAATLSFFACAAPAAFAWFFLWRFIAGAAGGVIMVLAAPAVLALVAPERRGLSGGIIFTGVGIGIAASGVLVPPLLLLGLSATWLGLGGIAAVMTLLSWQGWPTAAPAAAAAGARLPGAVLALIAVYGLNALGLVPHMIFLVDFVARGLGRGMAAGAACWVAFGIGAMLGQAAAGALDDRIGFRAALRLVLVAEAVTVAAPALSQTMPVLLASAAAAGAFTPGVVPLVLGRLQLMLKPGGAAAQAAWSGATVAWAVGQAGGAQALSAVFHATGGYTPLFAIGAAAFVAALALDLLTLRGAG